MSNVRYWLFAASALVCVIGLSVSPAPGQDIDLGGFGVSDDDGGTSSVDETTPTDPGSSPDSVDGMDQTGTIDIDTMGGDVSADVPEAGDDLRRQASEFFEDFIHYSRLARLDLAAANGQKFAEAALDPETILDVVESSPYDDDYVRDLTRMQGMKSEQAQQANIADIALAVEQKIDQARIAVVRNPQRIREEIAKLDDGLRPRLNATRRLKVAGEYAAPYMLQVIRGSSTEDQKLRPYVLEAMVDVGRPLVVPLCEALGSIGSVAQQDVARVLARIGYPIALPYLRARLADERTTAEAVAAMTEALQTIGRPRGIGPDAAPATLFLMLAEDYYDGRASLILEPEAAYNAMWHVGSDGRLTYRRVPTAVFGDVMAMRSARRALRHDPDLSPAMSLWVAANFRRENNLPAGMTDPSYGEQMRSPHFYAVLSGPSHLKPALSRAMADRDIALSLDVVRALQATAGTRSLTDDADAVLTALNYPHRRVRFEMALVVAEAGPHESFEGSGRVVPVLAEAVRQGDRRIAVVLAPDQARANQLAATVREAGDFEVLIGRSLGEVVDALATVSGVDVVVGHLGPQSAGQLIAARANNYKLQGAPLVVAAAPGELSSLNDMFASMADVVVVPGDAGQQQMTSALGQALQSMGTEPLTPEQAEQYATDALAMLRELSLTDSPVFDVVGAQSAVIDALDDARDAVASGAAGVLATLGTDAAQQALADAALATDRGTTLRITMLDSVAQNARAFGSRLTQVQKDKLLSLVRDATGDLADAAARAHGALNLPTAHGVQMIVQ